MRIVDRRFAAALLGLWLVLAAGLAAQAGSVNSSDPTITVTCPLSGVCRAGQSVYVSGDGLLIKTDADLDRYWIQTFFEPTEGYERVHVDADGTYWRWVTYDQPGTYDICLTYFKPSGQILTLVCTSVTIQVYPLG